MTVQATQQATQQDGTHPRPMLVREGWTSLDGSWGFAHDDEDAGRAAGWFRPGSAAAFDREIQVPYPPESTASGIGDRGFHPVVWYRRELPADALVVADGERVLLHLGAVDHRAEVWVDGQLVATHVGGQTPFSADITDLVRGDAGEAEGVAAQGDPHVVVVRAEDDPHSLVQPRGKQDWLPEPHGIWYHRTTGIWQPVWLEVVPADHVTDLGWTADLSAASAHLELTLARRVTRPLVLEVELSLGEERLARTTAVVAPADGPVVGLDLGIPALRNGQDRARLVWSPEQPTLVDAHVVLRDEATGEVVDTVGSYLGLREVGVAHGAFLLNGQPYFTRSVLDQGYRPDTHLAARDTKQLREEVELTKAMGFNAVRVHQKAEDPRFLFWADRLGLLVWGETAAAYAFTPEAVSLLTTEWAALVRRDRSHPSIVAWVPVNESWGVQDIAGEPAQQQFAQSLASLTRALDPTRPAMSNEGWEHVDSDVLGVHDYSSEAAVLTGRWGSRAAVEAQLAGPGPQGRRIALNDNQIEKFRAGDAPLMLTEFGGISMSTEANSWGYEQVSTTQEYAELLTGLFDALRAAPDVVGFCYTQLLDTGQETNGLALADGTPKLPVEQVFEIVTGRAPAGHERPTSTFGWS